MSGCRRAFHYRCEHPASLVLLKRHNGAAHTWFEGVALFFRWRKHHSLQNQVWKWAVDNCCSFRMSVNHLTPRWMLYLLLSVFNTLKKKTRQCWWILSKKRAERIPNRNFYMMGKLIVLWKDFPPNPNRQPNGRASVNDRKSMTIEIWQNIPSVWRMFDLWSPKRLIAISVEPFS